MASRKALARPHPDMLISTKAVNGRHADVTAIYMSWHLRPTGSAAMCDVVQIRGAHCSQWHSRPLHKLWQPCGNNQPCLSMRGRHNTTKCKVQQHYEESNHAALLPLGITVFSHPVIQLRVILLNFDMFDEPREQRCCPARRTVVSMMQKSTPI